MRLLVFRAVTQGQRSLGKFSTRNVQAQRLLLFQPWSNDLCGALSDQSCLPQHPPKP